jgi:DNA adenine methylase
MILRRLGNKKRIAQDIIKHFPPHRVYIEPFFGAGGIFFYKQRAKYNFLNDLDDDVYNLWNVFFNRRDELIEAVELMPYHESLFQYWRHNKETEPIRKAIRFLMLSNFGWMGMPNMMDFTDNSHKKELLKNANKILIDTDCRFMNVDFRKVFDKISLLPLSGKINGKRLTSLGLGLVFIYCDPPYLGTTDNYSNSFTEQDTTDLFTMCIDSKAKFAISEFDNPFILDLAKQHNLNVIKIGERQAMKARKTEILITNYKTQNTLF